MAQPMHETDKGRFVIFPDRVEVHPDGRIELVTREVGPITPGDVIPEMPASVETWAVRPDGSRVRGYPIRPSPENSNYPQEILFDQNGYEIIHFECITTHDSERAHENTHERRKGQTGWTVDSTQKDYLVRVTSREKWLNPVPSTPMQKKIADAQSERDAPFDLRYQLDQASYPAGQFAAIQEVLFRVEERLETILAQDTGLLRITGGFDPTIPAEVAAKTDTNLTVGSFTNVSANLVYFGFADNEPSQEVGLYERFPASVSVQKEPGVTITPSSIWFATSLGTKWFLPAHPISEAVMRIRSQTLWDYEYRDGIMTGAGDFEGVVTHEAIHGLGFVSTADIFVSPITLWDLFRLDRNSVGPTVDYSEFEFLPKMQDPTREAVLVLEAFSTLGIPRVSRGIRAGGDGFEAQHWKCLTAPVDPPSAVIGIMDPVEANYRKAPRRPYLSRADIGAIDQIGWNVDRNGPIREPGETILGAPADGAERVSYSPTLMWTNGPRAASRNLYMYEGVEVNSMVPYHQVIGVTGSSRAIPPGVLKANTTYYWFVTAINSYDGILSLPRTFTTLPSCPGDANGDRSVSFPDITSVLANFGTTYSPAPPGAFPGDANGDGTVGFPDVTAVLASFDTPCP